MLTQLVHNGVIVPETPEYQEIMIRIRGKEVKLTPKQEEMAFAWVRKIGTPYVDDPVFARNFLHDFSKELNIRPTLKIAEIDFAPVYKIVIAERDARERLTKEERKALAAERKEKREKLKEEFGWAVADGERIELANYIVEPSGIFMGRGKHPLRGRWKEGAKQNDITLNLSPDAAIPPGEWKEIVWQAESLWVARWDDKLADKLKYIWLHDSSPIKQAREAQKFDKATELGAYLEAVRQHIHKGLESENPRIRKIATACFLIDALCLRVGDEKDPDEADTVGATTLRPEHLKLHENGLSEFRFLGKDSVLWHKKIELPENVRKNLADLQEQARPSNSRKNRRNNKPQLFPDISSRNVNAFLSEAMPGLTAKVFRTHHATKVVKESLESSKVTPAVPEYEKWEAVVNANTEAAILCNHTKQAPKNWTERKQRYREREQNTREQLQKYKDQEKELAQKLKIVRAEAQEKIKSTKDKEKRAANKARYEKKISTLSSQIEHFKEMQKKTRAQLGKIQAQMKIAQQNRTWNLNTSQKSYIDPRVYFEWGKKVDYDVIDNYYSKTLKIKFQWVKNGFDELDDEVMSNVKREM